MSDSGNICPICGDGFLQAQIGKNIVGYKERTAELNLHYSVCGACGSEQSDATQLRDNKRAMIAFKKQVDGLLSGAEIRELRERQKISQVEAARIFGGGPVAFSKYESDDVAQSEAMDKLLRLSAAMPTAFAYLKRRAGLIAVETAQWTEERMVLSQTEHHGVHVVSSSTPMAEQSWRKSA